MSTKMKIAVLFGGKSGEHDVSLRSAAGVMAHLDREKYVLIPIGIDRDGIWYLQPEDSLPAMGKPIVLDKTRIVALLPGIGLQAAGQTLPVDFVLPILHGTFGEDGTMQGLLESVGLPYMGAGVLGSALGMDKGKVKEVWRQAGLPIVPFQRITRAEAQDAVLLERAAEQAQAEFGFPLFVKPACSGSSVGVHRIDDRPAFAAAVHDALRFDLSALIEPSIVGREIECSVIGNRYPEAFAPGEIESHHSFYDYEAKYLDPDGASLLIPAPLDRETEAAIRSIAVKAYRTACIEGLARIDFFLDNKNGQILLNEINTLPGFTDISMFAMLCESSGLPYPQLLDRLIALGMERHRERATIEYSN